MSGYHCYGQTCRSPQGYPAAWTERVDGCTPKLSPMHQRMLYKGLWGIHHAYTGIFSTFSGRVMVNAEFGLRTHTTLHAAFLQHSLG